MWEVSFFLLFCSLRSFFSTSASADVSLQDGRKGKTFTVSYLVDSLGLSRKLAESISRKVSFEEKSNPDSVLNLLISHGFTDSQGNLENKIRKHILYSLLIFTSFREACAKCILQFLLLCFYCCCNVSHKDGRKGKTFTVSYLVDSLGLTTKLAESISRKVSFEEKGNPDSVMGLFRSHGFTDSQISDIVTTSLKKVVDKGFDPTSSKFVQALSVFYQRSDKTIEEKVDVYKRLGLAVGDVWEMFKKYPFTLKFSEKKITQTFETLKKCGLLKDEILSMFKKFPRFIGSSEQRIESSLETFMSLGFSRDEFAMMLKRNPQYIGYSAESVKNKTEFLVKKMNWPIKALGSNPAVYNYSLEKRIVPRCNVIKALMSRGLLGNGSELPPLYVVLPITDEAFLVKYVRNHDDKQLVLELMSIFTNGTSVDD
ncbi:unnamed protein product [Thlaspi arvense]|uniref:Uncharacterized protein n=1 Tax=Thlaspi arvense TaxID=13288 RepID=A0AAU9RVD9_THLAR|nr:unnamed protein product [Thlaspi arvense]